MKREELLKNKGYWISRIQIDLYNQLSDYMKKTGLNRARLAKKLGVSKGYISQVLNGDFNHKLSTLVDLSLAMDKIPEIRFVDVNQLIEDETNSIKRVSRTLKISKTQIAGDDMPGRTSSASVIRNLPNKATIERSIMNFS